jgi:hypothetical protein
MTVSKSWLSLALVVVAAPALAQVGPALDPGVMVGWAGGEAVRYSNERRSRAPARAASPMRTLGQAMIARRGVAPAGAVDTRYRPSAEVRRRNLDQFVQRTRAVDPQAAVELERAFSRNLLGQIEGALSRKGLRADDAADATAAYLVTAWYGVRGEEENASPQQFRAVSRQIASAMAATPDFGAASDAMKQELSEAMLVQALLASQAVASARSNPALLDDVSNAIGQGARSSFGFDLRSIDLTEAGLSLGRLGAATDTPAAPASAPAPATAAASGPSTGVLLAAAAVGGIGLFLLGRRAGRRG